MLSCVTCIASLTLLFAYFKHGNLTEEYAMPFIAVSLFFFLEYIYRNRVSDLRVIICGSCFGCVCLLRPNMVTVWFVFCIAIAIKCIWNKSYRELGRFFVSFLIGLSIAVVPFILWLAWNGSLKAFWDVYIVFNFRYTADCSNIARWQAFYEFFRHPLVILAFVVSIYLCKTEDLFLYGTYVCYLFCTLLMMGMSGRAFNHYGMILVPAMVFPLAALFRLCPMKCFSDKGRFLSVCIALYLLIAFILPVWVPKIVELPDLYRSKNKENKYY